MPQANLRRMLTPKTYPPQNRLCSGGHCKLFYKVKSQPVAQEEQSHSWPWLSKGVSLPWRTVSNTTFRGRFPRGLLVRLSAQAGGTVPQSKFMKPHPHRPQVTWKSLLRQDTSGLVLVLGSVAMSHPKAELNALKFQGNGQQARPLGISPWTIFSRVLDQHQTLG